MDLEQPRRVGWLATALSVVAVSLTACGGENGEGGNADESSTSPTDSASAAEQDRILIKTQLHLPTVTILGSSTIGDAPFCAGGTAKDTHGTPEIGLVDRTIKCGDGTLRLGFDPQTPVGNTQRGPWRIISGTGAYEGWEGSGEMVTRYDRSDDSPHPSQGRERFTGTVSR